MRIGVFVKLILRYLTFFEWLRNTAYNVINNSYENWGFCKTNSTLFNFDKL